MNGQDPAASRAQIKSFAYKVLRRMRSAGDHTVQIEDIEGEMWVAWTKAAQVFNPEVGVSFRTFLYRGLQLHINRWVLNNLTRRVSEVHAISTNESLGEEEDDCVGDRIASVDMLAEDQLAQTEAFKLAQRMLSPKARIYLRLLADPPQELLEALKPVAHKQAIGRARNIRVSNFLSVTSSMVLDLMDMSRNDRTNILAEIRRVGDELRQNGAL